MLSSYLDFAPKPRFRNSSHTISFLSCPLFPEPKAHIYPEIFQHLIVFLILRVTIQRSSFPRPLACTDSIGHSADTARRQPTPTPSLVQNTIYSSALSILFGNWVSDYSRRVSLASPTYRSLIAQLYPGYGLLSHCLPKIVLIRQLVQKPYDPHAAFGHFADLNAGAPTGNAPQLGCAHIAFVNVIHRRAQIDSLSLKHGPRLCAFDHCRHPRISLFPRPRWTATQRSSQPTWSTRDEVVWQPP